MSNIESIARAIVRIMNEKNVTNNDDGPSIGQQGVNCRRGRNKNRFFPYVTKSNERKAAAKII